MDQFVMDYSLWKDDVVKVVVASTAGRPALWSDYFTDSYVKPLWFYAFDVFSEAQIAHFI